MDERLRRNIAPPTERSRYGRWELTGDLAPGEAPPATPTDDYDEWEVDEEEVRRLMRRQRRLSLSVASALMAVAFGVIIAGYAWPGTMSDPVWHGFSPLFLFSAILIYPLVWLVAIAYTIVANRMDGLG